MSSISDIQTIHSMLQEISRLLDEVDTKTDNVTKKAATSTESLKQLEAVAMRYLLIARRIGLPAEANAMLQKVTMMIVAINQLKLTLESAKVALAGAGPIGWLALGASAAYTALSFYSIGGQ